MASYVVQEEDGTSKFTLEEDGGALLTEESTAGGGSSVLTIDNTSTQWLFWGH